VGDLGCHFLGHLHSLTWLSLAQVRAGLGIGLGLGVRLIEQKGLPLSGAPAQPHMAVASAGEGRVGNRVRVRG